MLLYLCHQKVLQAPVTSDFHVLLSNYKIMGLLGGRLSSNNKVSGLQLGILRALHACYCTYDINKACRCIC